MERKVRHPSERPIRRESERKLGYTRRPFDEPLTPGLRRESNTNAIGFLANLSTEETDD
jgi:hypothetical protein